MSEKPIIFSTPMVQKIQEGLKTMTRRVIKPQFEIDARWESLVIEDKELKICGRGIGDLWETRHTVKMLYHCGDILWVRETWGYESAVNSNVKYCYRADEEHYDGGSWHPSIFMPRNAARIFLEVKNVRVERLQDITDEGALCEGVFSRSLANAYFVNHPRMAFEDSWNTINAKRGSSWDSNPWVWVIEFERVKYL